MSEAGMHERLGPVDLPDKRVVRTDQVGMAEQYPPQNMEHDARNQRLKTHPLLLDRLDDLPIATFDPAAPPHPKEGMPEGEESVFDQTSDIRAVEPDPPLVPPNLRIGRIGMPLVREKQQHAPCLDNRRRARRRLETTPPGRDVDQLVLVQNTTFSLAEVVSGRMARDRVVGTGRYVLVSGRSTDHTPQFVARRMGQIVQDISGMFSHVSKLYILCQKGNADPIFVR